MPPRSLLLIKPGSMGDVIHALPVASAIHEAWPDTEITWLVDTRWEALLVGNPAISRIHTFPRQDFCGAAGLLRAIRWYARLRDLEPALALDLQGLFRSGLMAKLSNARRIHGLGDAREGASFFYTTTTPVEANEHAVRRYLRCLPAIGLPVPEVPDFFLPPGRLRPEVPADYVLLHPFSRGENKSLGPGAVRILVREIVRATGWRVVLVGTGVAPADLDSGVMDLLDRTGLEDLIGLIRRARFVVSVDSGPMHLAAALGVPLLGIHTWSDPRKVGPFGEEAWIWQGGEIRRQDPCKSPLPEQIFSDRHAEEVAKFVAAGVTMR